jgi:hypothetical protein
MSEGRSRAGWGIALAAAALAGGIAWSARSRPPGARPAPAAVMPPVAAAVPAVMSRPPVPASPKAEEPPARPKRTEAPPPPVPREEAAPAGRPEPDPGKPLEVSFAKLMFKYWPPIKGGRDPFPVHVRALSGRSVAIEGRMEFEKEELKAYVLTCPTPGCCSGTTPQITHRVKVILPKDTVMTVPTMVRVTGTFVVGEEVDPEGYIVSVYRLNADSVAPMPAPPPEK